MPKQPSHCKKEINKVCSSFRAYAITQSVYFVRSMPLVASLRPSLLFPFTCLRITFTLLAPTILTAGCTSSQSPPPDAPARLHSAEDSLDWTTASFQYQPKRLSYTYSLPWIPVAHCYPPSAPFSPPPSAAHRQRWRGSYSQCFQGEYESPRGPASGRRCRGTGRRRGGRGTAWGGFGRRTAWEEKKRDRGTGGRGEIAAERWGGDGGKGEITGRDSMLGRPWKVGYLEGNGPPLEEAIHRIPTRCAKLSQQYCTAGTREVSTCRCVVPGALNHQE